MAPPPPPPIALFPPAPGTKLVSSALQGALDAAIASLTSVTGGNPPKFSLTIVDGKGTGNGDEFGSAGFIQDVEHYAASMLKVACMYAAYALRNLVQRFAALRKPKDLNDLFRMLHAELDPKIAVCCPMVMAGASKVRLPLWQDVFTGSGNGAGMTVRFTPAYALAIERMIVPSDTRASGQCIRGVGYAYLNGLMLEHGFFNASTKKGVWLAGDYEGAEVITIPCDNDRDTKQGTTTAAMATLGTVIMHSGTIPSAHAEMIELLRKSSRGPDSSYFTRPLTNPHNLSHDQVTHGKLGWGPLKSRVVVLSDLNVINNPIGKGGHFLVCYTNVDQVTSYYSYVLYTFLEAMKIYQSASPSAAVAPTSTAVSGPRITP